MQAITLEWKEKQSKHTSWKKAVSQRKLAVDERVEIEWRWRMIQPIL